MVDGVSLRGVVALEVDGRQLQLKSESGLGAGRDLQLGRAFQEALGDLKLVGLLIHRAEHGQKAGIGERILVSGRRHLLHLGNGLIVQAEFMMRADHAGPCG